MREQILCFGEIVWDYLPNGRKPGGAPMNVAFHLIKLGLKSKVSSSVGADDDGMEILEFFKKSGLDTQLVQINNDLPTGEARVTLDEKNNAAFKIANPVAWDDIKITPELLEEADKSKAIIYGSIIARNKQTRETLFQLLSLDFIKILDVNLRAPDYTKELINSLLLKSNIVKLNNEEFILISDWYNISGSVSERLCKFQEKFHFDSLIVTRGEKGAILINNGIIYEHRGFKVNTVDTVGSGDAFLAGFVAARFEGKGMDQVLKEACAIGAFIASQAGATPNYEKEIISTIL